MEPYMIFLGAYCYQSNNTKKYEFANPTFFRDALYIYLSIAVGSVEDCDSKNGYERSIESNSRQLGQQHFDLIHKSSSGWPYQIGF
jgi:hypothetical protein